MYHLRRRGGVLFCIKKKSQLDVSESGGLAGVDSVEQCNAKTFHFHVNNIELFRTPCAVSEHRCGDGRF